MIPVLTYPDVRAAVDWMVEVLGFVEQVWIGPNHRAQLSFGDGSLIVADATRERVLPTDGEVTQSVMLRVEDAASVCKWVGENGATIVDEPTDFEYGERQCSFVDPWDHRWTLTQTLRDVAPEDWGGRSGGAVANGPALLGVESAGLEHRSDSVTRRSFARRGAVRRLADALFV